MNLFSFFGRYRTLDAELEDAVARRIVAEDEARYWRGKAEVWEAEAHKAQEEKDVSHKALIDWTAMRLTGYPIFGSAPPLPREALPNDRPVERPMGRRLARDIVNESAAALERELAAYNTSKTQQ